MDCSLAREGSAKPSTVIQLHQHNHSNIDKKRRRPLDKKASSKYNNNNSKHGENIKPNIMYDEYHILFNTGYICYIVKYSKRKQLFHPLFTLDIG